MITSSKMSSAPYCVAGGAGPRGSRARRDDAHVAGDRLDDDRGDLSPCSAKRRLDRLEIVVRHDERVAGGRAGRRRESGMPSVATPRSGRGEERVGVAVVAAGELHDLVATGEAAREAQRASSSPRCPRRPGGPSPSTVRASRDRLGELDLVSVGAPNVVPWLVASRSRRRPRVGMAEDERAPAADQSMYRLPSTSVMYAPSPATRNAASRRRANARTGEFTPRG